MADQTDEKANEQPVKQPVSITQELVIAQELVEKIGEFINETFPTLLDVDTGELQQSCQITEKQEKEVIEKMIIADQKCSALKDDAKYLLSSLKRVVNLALVRCRVDDDCVFKRFEEDLDEEIMEEKLDKIKVSNQAAVEAVIAVKGSIRILTEFCKTRIYQLPKVETRMVNKKRQEYVKKLAGVVALVKILDELHPAIQIGAGIAGFAISVAHTESDVATIRKRFEEAINHLQNAEERWSQYQKIVESLHDDLTKLSNDWMTLKEETVPLARESCRNCLGNEKAQSRKDWKEEFVKALNDIKETCNKAMGVGMMQTDKKLSEA